MSTDRDVTTRIVRSWLHEDAHEDADRILDLVLDEIDTTPQRSASWLARRFPIMNSNMFRVGIAAAVVIVLAFVGLRFLPGSGSFGGPPPPTPTPTLEPSPSPVPPLNGDLSQPPGRYQVDLALPMKVTVQVPEGWSANGNWVVIGPKGNLAPDGMAVRFYGGALNLYTDPLAPGAGELVPAVGPSVDELVSAVVDHPGWTTTDPTPITIDGYSGQVLHVTLPAGTSDATPFYLFVDPAGGQIWGWAAGQLFDVYVIDVGGERLVIDAFHYPGTSASDVAAQTDVINSVKLAPKP